MKVSAYRNLNRAGVQFSIRHKGRVIGYRETVVLGNAKFKHPTKKALGRIREGNREVCAWVSGELLESLPDMKNARPLRCDPKRFDTFQDHQGNRIDSAAKVILTEKGAFFILG